MNWNTELDKAEKGRIKSVTPLSAYSIVDVIRWPFIEPCDAFWFIQNIYWGRNLSHTSKSTVYVTYFQYEGALYSLNMKQTARFKCQKKNTFLFFIRTQVHNLDCSVSRRHLNTIW